MNFISSTINMMNYNNQFLKNIEPFCKQSHLVMVYYCFNVLWILITNIPYMFSIGTHKRDCCIVYILGCNIPGYSSLNLLKLLMYKNC